MKDINHTLSIISLNGNEISTPNKRQRLEKCRKNNKTLKKMETIYQINSKQRDLA